MDSEIYEDETSELELLSDDEMASFMDELCDELEEEGIDSTEFLNYIESDDEGSDGVVEEILGEAQQFKKKSSNVRAKQKKYMKKWLKGSAGKMYKKNQAKRRAKIKKGQIKMNNPAAKLRSKQRQKWAKVYSSFEPEEGDDLMEYTEDEAVETDETVETEFIDLADYLDDDTIAVLVENELIQEDGLVDDLMYEMIYENEDEEIQVDDDLFEEFVFSLDEILTEEEGEEFDLEDAVLIHDALEEIALLEANIWANSPKPQGTDSGEASKQQQTIDSAPSSKKSRDDSRKAKKAKNRADSIAGAKSGAKKGAIAGAAVGVGSAALQKVGQKLQDRKIKKLEGKGKSLSYKQKDKLAKLQSKKANRKKVTIGTALKRGAAGAAAGAAVGAASGTRTGRAFIKKQAKKAGRTRVGSAAKDAAGAAKDAAGAVKAAAGRKARAAKKGARSGDNQVDMYGNVKKTKRTLRNRASGFIKGLAASFDAETLNVDGHMEVMFEDSEFSEEFIERAGTIFKSAVGQEIQVQLQEIDEQVESHITEVEEQLAEEMTDNVDKYLNYVTEEWMEENQVAVEQQLRTELAEDFIVGLKNLFDAHYIDVPESKVDLVDTLQEKIEILEEKLNDTINENIELSKGYDLAAKAAAIDEFTTDLNIQETQKFKELAQSVEVDEDMVDNLQVIKEGYFGATASHSEDNEPVELTEGSIAAYTAVLDRTLSN